MSRIHLFLAVLALAACTRTVDNAQRASERANEEVINLTNVVRDLTTYHPKPTALKPVEPTWCYRVMQDITCYNKPIAGAESRLVAYQGPPEAAYAPLPVTAPTPTLAPTPVAPVVEAKSEPAAPLSRAEQSMQRFSHVKPLSVPPAPEVAGQ